MAKKKKTASTGGVLGALATTAFSDEGAAAAALFSASEASLPPAPPAAPKVSEKDDYDATLDRVLAKPAKKRSKAPPPRREAGQEAAQGAERSRRLRTTPPPGPFSWAICRAKPPRNSRRFLAVRRRTILPETVRGRQGVRSTLMGMTNSCSQRCARKGLLSDAKRTTNAYVVFEDLEGATNALKANGAVWKIPASIEDGVETPEETFHLRVDKASGDRGAQDHLRTAFVGNCPFDSSEEGLRELFAAHLQESGGHAAVENVRCQARQGAPVCWCRACC